VAAIEVESVSRSYDGLQALRNVTFLAERGERVALIGPNGAGKTTLLEIAAGIRSADSGRVSVVGGPAGWVPQRAALYRRLSVEENLRLFARLEHVADVDQAVEAMLDQTGLRDRRGDQVSSLSGGNQQRVNIAIGLLSRPEVLLLDEPTTALDPRQRERLWDFIRTLGEGGTSVLFATHNIAEAERYGERLLVLADGELLFDGDPAGLHAAEPDSPGGNFEAAFVAFLKAKGH